MSPEYDRPGSSYEVYGEFMAEQSSDGDRCLSLFSVRVAHAACPTLVWACESQVALLR